MFARKITANDKKNDSERMTFWNMRPTPKTAAFFGCTAEIILRPGQEICVKNGRTRVRETPGMGYDLVDTRIQRWLRWIKSVVPIQVASHILYYV